jgi:hypothetical protein
MLTRDQAINSREFHYNGPDHSRYGGNYGRAINCTVTVGPKGGVKINKLIVRRNGATQLWKTRPEEYRIPVKEGFKGYGSITQDNAAHYHTADNCPLLLADIHLGTYSQRIPSYSEHMRAVQSHLEHCADCRDGKPQ